MHAVHQSRHVSRARCVFANFNANIEDLPRSLQTYHLALTYWPCHTVYLRSEATAAPAVPGLIRLECTSRSLVRMYLRRQSVNLFSGSVFTAARA